MSYAKVFSAQPGAVKAMLVEVECDSSKGTYAFQIVGLPGKDVDESKDRVASAIKNSDLRSLKADNKKIICSLSPASVKKEGSHFDLPIALSVLKSCGYINFPEKEKMFIGELSLSGEILPVKGTLSIIELARKKGFKEVYIPAKNINEGSLAEGIKVFAVKNLKEVVQHLDTESKLPKLSPVEIKIENEVNINEDPFEYIIGQENAKRALKIAAAGGHNVVFFGPPGTGKTLLASSFSKLLPKLSKASSLEVTGIHTFCGAVENEIVESAPFRSPHHSSSHIALVGGGANMRPGEITLAHKGVLFMDEFPEFDRKCIESLRQPLESGVVTVSRAKGTVTYPAQFTLIAAMNPCPCGYKGSKHKTCVCREIDILKYQKKISGPIMDRIDLWVEVPHIPLEEFTQNKVKNTKNTSTNIKEEIIKARDHQYKRFGKEKLNKEMTTKDINELLFFGTGAEKLLIELSQKINLSPRVFQRLKKISRTIADLEHSKSIEQKHILEAFQFRPKL